MGLESDTKDRGLSEGAGRGRLYRRPGGRAGRGNDRHATQGPWYGRERAGGGAAEGDIVLHPETGNYRTR